MNAPFSPGRGFQDPVLGPQAVFRSVLSAMSRPGNIAPVPDAGVEGPAAAPQEVLAILLALCDHETPVWLDAALRNAIAPWLAFHANCPIVDDPARAAFGVLRACAGNPPLSAFAAGEERYPDRSTTLIVLAENLTTGASLFLEGPGIESRARIAPAGLPDGFVAQAQANRDLYPRGLDFLLFAERGICGLPRSTRIFTEVR